MAILYALLAAAAYGVSDFIGGIASRRVAALHVLVISYPVGGLLMATMLPWYGGPISATTWSWSVAGGAAGLTGVALLYSALAQAPMNIVSPVTAVMSALVPVFGGVVRGERPHLLAWLGIVLGLVAVVLISRQPSDHPHGPVGARPLLMAVGAGVGFGAYFICLASADHDSGMWPVVISRVCSSLLVLPLVVGPFAVSRLPPLGRRAHSGGGAPGALTGAVVVLAVVAGILDASANVAFLLASRHGLLSLSGVITALYPAGTVLLAVLILKEHTGKLQRAGLGLATAAVVLLTR
jgi:drug/metabolite transporter (DMT)-like permease